MYLTHLRLPKSLMWVKITVWYSGNPLKIMEGSQYLVRVSADTTLSKHFLKNNLNTKAGKSTSKESEIIKNHLDCSAISLVLHVLSFKRWWSLLKGQLSNIASREIHVPHVTYRVTAQQYISSWLQVQVPSYTVCTKHTKTSLSVSPLALVCNAWSCSQVRDTFH